MELIRGVTLLTHQVHTDARGSLIVLEQITNLPFPLKRVFVTMVDDSDAVRGGHANSCDEFIVALSGSVLVEVDNGRERTCVRLSGHDQGLWIRAGILIDLREFTAPTVLLVCASAFYEDTHHFAHPQLHLASSPANLA
jgi:dTDP-4-dehydrorhamnose 3,5-epimerase-like enzyme